MKMEKKYAVLKQNRHGKSVNKEKLKQSSCNKKTTKLGLNQKSINKNKKVNKKMIISLSFIFVMIFIVTLATSYAFFTTTVKGKEFVIYTGNLAVGYAKKTDVINVENLYPMKDAEGLATTPHEFTITNTGNIEARYQIRLELDEAVKDMIDIRYIKLSYQENGKEYSTPVLLSDLNSSLVFVKNVILPPKKNNSNTYGIKLWIDLGAPNDIQGKMFKAKVVVDSIQNVEDGYVVDTAPIIYLNKDNSGNQDIHLKTNETYTELGVEKIEDDQEMFTPSQVNLSYEYYDGTNLTTVSSVDTSKNGIYYVTYSITDKSGNVSKRVRVVTINNTDTVPSISLNGDASISLGEGDYYKENGVTVTDDNKVITIGEVKTSTVGTYVVRYIVVDKNGNLNSVTRTVTIIKAYQESILNGADPVLTSNLVPVQIADNGTVKRASTSSTWYDYETKQWANAVVLKDDTVNYTNGQTIPEDNIESYFVWIPKYKYKLWDLGNYSSAVASTPTDSKAREIEIVFGTGNTENVEGVSCVTPMLSGESGECNVGEYMTHPAFISMGTNGLWVAKFETSGDTSDINVLPNVAGLRRLNVKTMFELAYNYDRNLDSHMMKNTEWGAVAYLSHSKYGINKEVNINNNSAYLTGYSAVVGTDQSSHPGIYGTDASVTQTYDTETGYLASTTGNITGIYDMSGGSHEYMASYVSDQIGASEFSDVTNTSYAKYIDVYSSSSAVTSYQYRILGDATGEMGPFYNYADKDGDNRYHNSWYADYSYFVSLTNPWFGRGSLYYDGVLAGQFVFTSNTGGPNNGIGFRVVLAP